MVTIREQKTNRVVLSTEEKLIRKIVTGLNLNPEVNRYLNWDYILQLAMYHQLESMVFAKLTIPNLDIGESEISQKVWQNFINKLENNYVQELKLIKLINSIVKISSQYEAKIVFWRNYWQNHSNHSSYKFCPTNSVDLLINSQDLKCLRELLLTSDFEQVPYPIDKISKVEKTDGLYWLSFFYENDNQELQIQVSRNFLGSIKLAPNNISTVVCRGHKIYTLEPELLLLLLILKTEQEKKLEFNLGDLSDIYYLSCQINLTIFTQLVKETGQENTTYFWLKLIYYVFPSSHLDNFINEVSNYVDDTCKQKVRIISDRLDLLLKPGRLYFSQVKASYLQVIDEPKIMSKLIKLTSFFKQLFYISDSELEKLYFESFNNFLDTSFTYCWHLFKTIRLCLMLGKVNIFKM